MGADFTNEQSPLQLAGNVLYTSLVLASSDRWLRILDGVGTFNITFGYLFEASKPKLPASAQPHGL